MQTIVLCVAQYMADGRADEIHFRLTWSNTAAVPWPHACHSAEVDAHFCRRCGPKLPDPFREDWLPARPEVTRAFASFSKEGAERSTPMSQSYAPLFVARRGVTDVKFVGQLQRPWQRPDLVRVRAVSPELAPLFADVYRRPESDEPRHVLADRLQAMGDPRGTFIAYQLHPDPTPAMLAEADRLEEAHRNDWLGALLPIVSPSVCRFTRGFVDTAVIGEAPQSVVDAASIAPEWATVETVEFRTRFDSTTQTFSSQFRSARHVIVDSTGMLYEQGTECAWAMESVRCRTVFRTHYLAGIQCPNLRRLTTGAYYGVERHIVNELIDKPWWSQLDEVSLLLSRPSHALAEMIAATPGRLRLVAWQDRLVVLRVAPNRVDVRAFPSDRATAASLIETLQTGLGADWQVGPGVDLSEAPEFDELGHILRHFFDDPEDAA